MTAHRTILRALAAHAGEIRFAYYQPGQGGAFEAMPCGRATLERSLCDMMEQRIIELMECDLVRESYKFRRVKTNP